jgi:hypothetical protein
MCGVEKMTSYEDVYTKILPKAKAAFEKHNNDRGNEYLKLDLYQRLGILRAKLDKMEPQILLTMDSIVTPAMFREDEIDLLNWVIFFIQEAESLMEEEEEEK